MDEILKRDIVDEINKFMNDGEAIVLHGARQVGKTCILRYLEKQLIDRGKTTYFIDLEDSRYVRILDEGVDAFLKHLEEEGISSPKRGKKCFVFIDEIQYLANPSSFLKLVVDHQKSIKLIVSGSSSFSIKTKFKDSLVGRTIHFEIFPLSFKEFLFFNQIHFENDKVYTEKKRDELRGKFKEYTLHGGYPRIVLTPEVDKKEKYLQQIIDTYIKKDIRDLANVKDIDKFNKLLEVFAGQSGQMLNMKEISNTSRMSVQTIERHLFILENTYILKLVRPFSKNIRSELFKLPKIYFYDAGLMQMLWLKGLPREVIGQVFETAVFSELVKKYGRENIFHWRTKDKKEIDFILKKKNVLLPIEVKINYEQFNPNAIRYFSAHYGVDGYKVVGLKGTPKDEHFVYPWEA